MNMHTKSVQISTDLLSRLEDAIKGKDVSELIEKVMSEYADKLKEKRRQKEIETLNRIAEEQHEEIMETLETRERRYLSQSDS